MALLTSLIAAWELDEASGNALDSVGTLDLTENGTIASATGPNANVGGRDFESGDSSDYFSRSSSSDLETGEDFSVEVWIKPESTGSTVQFICGKITWGGSDKEWYLARETDGTVTCRVYLDPGNTPITLTSSALSNGTWYQLILSYDYTSKSMAFYVNNSPVSGSPYNHSGLYTMISHNSSPLMVGDFDPTIPTNYWFDGTISLFRFWKRVLTSDDRRKLYNSGYGLAYADFDVAPTTTIIDVDTGGTGDYTTLNAANDGEKRNLLPTVGTNEIIIFDCRASGGAADTTPANIGGWETDQDHYVIIRSSGSNKHTGTWSTSKYRLAVQSWSGASALTISSVYTEVEGLQISVATSASFQAMAAIYSAAKYRFRVRDCIIQYNGGHVSSDVYGLNTSTDQSSGELSYIYNNLFINLSSDGRSYGYRHATYGGGTYYVENNTFINGGTDSSPIGLNLADNDFCIARNNLVYNFGNTNTYIGTFATGTDYNTTDSTDSIGTGSNNSTSQTFTFTNAAGGDYSLASGDTGARNKGSLLSAVSSGFTTDIIGTARDAIGAIDCGCFEYVAVISTSFIYFKRPTRVWNRRL